IYYGATMRVQDEEMAEKVREHETRRSAVWETVDCTTQLPVTLDSTIPILFDGLDIWVLNQMMDNNEVTSTTLLQQWTTWLNQCKDEQRHVTIVSTEMSFAGISPDRFTRMYQRLLGALHQQLAAESHRVTLIVAGIPLEVK
ncbi:MAG: bifunctional adenosylcobinamide kinase/adenosylcobinamide-phosphate guanylyltransferase, partial [Bacilli bacterium]